MGIRTDLAMESAAEILSECNISGIENRTRRIDELDLEITDINITTPQAALRVGRPQGRYITVRASDGTFDHFSPCFEKRCEVIAEQIRLLAGNAERVLAAGLGNRDITPDAVGPLCADRIFATRHIKKYASEIDSSDLTEMSVIQPGVMGKTGIEASEQVKATVDSIKPAAVIAVDALACSEIDNLGCTIQMCDTGISPGSGVQNSRKELSESTLGVPCIAIGVPMVIDLSTAAEKMFSASANEKAARMTVTPRNVDKLAANCAEYISLSIDLAFQKSLTAEELRSLTQ